ncbi:hypothetical protein NPIL_564991, partial [Nephila pilipes]
KPSALVQKSRTIALKSDEVLQTALKITQSIRFSRIAIHKDIEMSKGVDDIIKSSAELWYNFSGNSPVGLESNFIHIFTPQQQSVSSEDVINQRPMREGSQSSD